VRPIRRRLTALGAVLLLAGSVPAATGPAGAAPAPRFWPKDPAHNIKPKPDVTDFSSICGQAGRSAKCGAQIVRALNHARAKLGRRAYALPPRFLSLSGRDQLLVLSNDDRRAYHETPIRGRNATLDHNADTAAARSQDPPGVPAIHRHPALTIGSTLALGSGGVYTNPLFDYYEWMYFDGPGSNNVDCPAPNSPGCWGHRHVTLYKGSDGHEILMGVGTAHTPSGYTAWTELYESFQPGVHLPFVPTVTDLSRHRGSTAGGDRVVVSGFGFRRAESVQVGGRHARIVDRSNTRLVVRTPAHPAGPGYVVVVGSGGDSARSAAAKYRYG
jgi:hypothetical protein